MSSVAFIRKASVCSGRLIICISLLIAIIALVPVANAQPVAAAPYSVAVFATNPAGMSKPDSIAVSATNVFVGYGNGGNPDGSGGAKSDVVEYDLTGKSIKSFAITGHNDGLKIDPVSGDLWALQNEDGNANLVVINLKNGKEKTYQVGTGPHGGGYDDIVFHGKSVFLSASAPTHNPNTAPAIVSLKLKGKDTVLTGVLNGNAQATNITTGATETLNLQDPDSMITDPFGELLLDSQGDGELIVVQHPGLSCQKALLIPLTSEDGGPTIGNTQLDDTAFATEAGGQILVADKDLGAVYSIRAPYFAPGAAYSAVSVFSSPSAPDPIKSFVGQTNLSTGFVTPIVTGMSNPGGMAFIPTEADADHKVAALDEEAGECP